jgi:G3E family GTPase
MKKEVNKIKKFIKTNKFPIYYTITLIIAVVIILNFNKDVTIKFSNPTTKCDTVVIDKTDAVTIKKLSKEIKKLKRQSKEDDRQIEFLQHNYEKAVEMIQTK